MRTNVSSSAILTLPGFGGPLRGPPACKTGRVDPDDPLPCSEAHAVARGLLPAASAPRHMSFLRSWRDVVDTRELGLHLSVYWKVFLVS